MDEKRDLKFDKLAEDYDDGFEGKLSEKFYTLVTENVELSDGMDVLEMGCGTGTILYRLSQKCRINGYGIDTEEKMLEQARKKCPDMQILLAPCDAVPYEDGKFDVIAACMAYHHFPDRKAFARECARLLKPGGRLYIADPRLPLPIRKALNAALEIHRINGKVSTADELCENFIGCGFTKLYEKHDSYAQLVCLERERQGGI